MTPDASLLERLTPLVIAQLDGDIAPCDADELDRLICQSEEVRQLYLSLIRESVSLRYWSGSTADNPPTGSSPDDAEHVSPPLSSADRPIVALLDAAVPGTSGYFSSGWPVAYLVATVILGLGLLIGSRIYVSHSTQIARQSAPLPSGEKGTGPLCQNGPQGARHKVDLSPSSPPFVGRITGMVDCQWADPTTAVPGPVAVPLGRKYALASGLMEITYDTGAKVILQGPCTYEVESKDGGFLSVGKLTARVEKKEEGGTKNEELSASTSSFLVSHSYFAVRTPTAIVTDLGTEFGVEVDKQGGTTSHVYRGLVRLQVMAADGRSEDAAKVLHENESARVENRGNQGDGNPMIVAAPSAKPADFVREIPRQTTKVFDLVDVVAGGDGFSGRRGRGIDPTNGGVATTLQSAGPTPMSGDGHYHRVASMPLIDGVFIPDGRAGPVQVDSAGHVFDGFLATANIAWNPIWAGGPLETPTKLGKVDYAVPPHGLLLLASNNAITFDLEAIRRSNGGLKLWRFCAVAANTATPGFEGCDLADIRVLIDGQRRFQRRQIRNEHGVFSVRIWIQDKDRFLTLATTDGGDGISGDWVTFGDPRLELLQAKAANLPSEEETQGEQLPQQGQE